MEYKATRMIAETFNTRGIKFRIIETESFSAVEAGFEVEAGPDVLVRLISKDNGNDVAVRVFGLIHKIPPEKRSAVVEACNTLTERVRFFKFYLGSNGDVNVEADLPRQTGDDSVGECCFELFMRMMSLLNHEYHVLAEALYGGAGEVKEKIRQEAPETIPARGADLKLRLVSTGETLRLSGKTQYEIGRSPERDVCIPNYMVSRRHCAFRFRNGDWYLQNLQALNGTTVNGTRIPKESPVLLRKGDDIILAGAVSIRFEGGQSC